MNSAPQFKTKSGTLFSGVTLEALNAARTRLDNDYQIGSTQWVEAASYSMAMVVRYALGLFAQDSQVCVLTADALPGWVSLATFRHLFNAGAKGCVIDLTDGSAPRSEEFQRQVHPLQMMGVPIEPLAMSDAALILKQLLPSCHNVILGLFGGISDWNQSSPLIDLLNDFQTPIHTVEAPLGIDPNSGAPVLSPLYCSSTLSIGAPLAGLYAGHDFVGRHYLCDISIPAELYSEMGSALGALFTEQPVLQIFPNLPDDAQNSKE